MTTDEQNIEINPPLTASELEKLEKSLDDMVAPTAEDLTNVMQEKFLPLMRRIMHEAHAGLFYVGQHEQQMQMMGGVDDPDDSDVGLLPDDADSIRNALKFADEFASEVKRSGTHELLAAKIAKLQVLCRENIALVDELELSDDPDDDDDGRG